MNIQLFQLALEDLQFRAMRFEVEFGFALAVLALELLHHLLLAFHLMLVDRLEL